MRGPRTQFARNSSQRLRLKLQQHKHNVCACLDGFCRRNLSLTTKSACLQGDADSQQRSDTAGDAHNTYIWGTRLVIADMQAKIRRFLRDFKREGTSKALYVTLITQVGLLCLQRCLGMKDKLVCRIIEACLGPTKKLTDMRPQPAQQAWQEHWQLLLQVGSRCMRGCAADPWCSIMHTTCSCSCCRVHGHPG